MKTSNYSSRTLVLFAIMAALLLPAARCGQGQTNSADIQGSSLQGSGPSSGITVKPAPAGSAWSYGSVSPAALARPLIDRINDYRLARGLSRLYWHDGMASVSLAHSNDMQARNFFSIVNPDGVDLFQQLVSSSPRIDFDNAWAFVFVLKSAGGSFAANADIIFDAMLENSVTRALIESSRPTHFVSRTPAGSAAHTMIFAQNARPQY